jgi:predicted DNA-binding transcriptional regulator AlpA
MAVKKSANRLLGMKEIAEYAGYSRTTVIKMINEENFPAAKLNGSGWESDTELIDVWRMQKILSLTDQKEQA